MSPFWFSKEPVILAIQAHQVIYLEDLKNGANWNIQVVQNKCRWDVPEVEDVENEQLNVLKIVVGHHVDEHVKDNTLCRPDFDPAMVERLIVHHFVNDFIKDDDEQLSIQRRTSDDD
ncbi:uncharacterized protein E5676_scaffold416G00470 [Cucumis melo var. makuwa]|uniref:DUF4216 domain-containing protein n=1 Tax=Cucumis melo var. makuwa TaxID=1194695 RepID=A0A5D3D7W4_CUCMM|nr:uncharacterized protein E6C27_scaffold233G00090 [Cucumis melo var. makuwa]TYK19550.1 uncharacterized protein E5676_scaffold416G00470 [Cucumis melo var. makuwa]